MKKLLLFAIGGCTIFMLNCASEKSDFAKAGEKYALKLTQTLKGHASPITSVSISHDNKYMASCSGDSIVKIWVIPSGQVIKTLSAFDKNDVKTLSFNPKKPLLAVAAHSVIHILKIPSGESLKQFSHTMKVGAYEAAVEVVRLSWNIEGNNLISSGVRSIIIWWDIEGETLYSTLDAHEGWIYCTTFSTDGKSFLTESSGEGVKIWDIESFKLVKNIKVDKGNGGECAFSAKDSYFASTNVKKIELWDWSSRTLIKKFYTTSEVRALCFSSMDSVLALGNADGTIQIWQIPSATLLTSIQGHTKWISSLAFSLDGKYLVSGSGDKTVKLWELQLPIAKEGN